MSGTTESKTLHDIKFSVLDLAPVNEGSTPADAFRNSLDLAQHAEKWGFNRYWVAEHHNMPGIASSATSVVIGYLAGGTKTIRLGSGGIMLPNHASLVIAEQFGTLESMYPGRIDLGLGRAPGSDQNTARALRRTLGTTGDEFPQQLEELRAYFSENSRFVKAIPGQGLNIPIWLLGSSGFSARLSGRLGLPFAFASHFAPNYTIPALKTYRDHFTPSEHLQTPYAMVGVNVVAADTEEEAKRLATSQQQQFLSLIRGTPTQLKPPVDDMEQVWTPYEKSIIAEKLDSTIVGTKETVKARLEQFLADTDADEIIINSQIFDHKARLRSYEIIAELMS
ncbi:LLM class flavin-dependent oxidoreductase [Priestia filamentosa]|uniref:LLM class flavin-dependent oxidoreductase n=1 Tax=Priestia filamentosa TaxID=1402861 RepID=UPI001FB514EE|nr:LLM class flavin-dependent oxidoreductase [Priestia filamentosa]MED3728613.1 LLM class flavin-dependent oxidoreductase [Priestia filamentosa]UOE62508.1 LLM class flavin-dependent oxidoreductase [Priestia filamentosa]